jgi:hypothetical protein
MASISSSSRNRSATSHTGGPGSKQRRLNDADAEDLDGDHNDPFDRHVKPLQDGDSISSNEPSRDSPTDFNDEAQNPGI